MKSNTCHARESGQPKISNMDSRFRGNDGVQIVDIGLVDYLTADKLQCEIAAKVKAGISENSLILAEFTPVCTLGRKGDLGNLLVSEDFLKKEGIRVCNVDRGGDITVHNEGQLVVYPIINLAQIKQDVNWYIRSLEEIIIRLLLDYGIFGGRRPGLSGVWVGGEKIAFIGIAISRWVTYHGLAINVNNDLSIFDFITPCGIKGCEVTSIAKIKGGAVDMRELKGRLIEHFTVILSEAKNLKDSSGPLGLQNDSERFSRDDENIGTAAVA